MPLKIEVSVMQVGTSLRVTIPKEVAAHLDLKKGDTVQFWADNSHVIFREKEVDRQRHNQTFKCFRNLFGFQ